MCKDNVQSNQINSWSYIWTLSLYQSRATNHHEYRRVEVVVPTYTKRKIWPLWSMVFTQFSGRFLFKKKNNCLHDLTIKEMKSLMGSCGNSLHTNYSIFFIIKNGPRPCKKTKKTKKRDRALFQTLMSVGFWWAHNELNPLPRFS